MQKIMKSLKENYVILRCYYKTQSMTDRANRRFMKINPYYKCFTNKLFSFVSFIIYYLEETYILYVTLGSILEVIRGIIFLVRILFENKNIF